MTSQGDHERAAETYAQIAQWMLWVLLPSTAVMVLAGNLVLRILGPAFPQGAPWLAIVAIGLAINAFVSLGETVIMVQRPRLNLLHSSITAAITVATNLFLIPRYGPTGAAFGILIPFSVQGLLRYFAMRFIFKWKSAWSSLRPPIFAALLASLPAMLFRLSLHGIAGQLVAAISFLAIFGASWLFYRKRAAKYV
jgi:O-antigen/teichoic acid export membrane protein